MKHCCMCGKELDNKGLFFGMMFGEAKHESNISYHIVKPPVVCSTDCMLKLMHEQIGHVKHWVTDIYPALENITEVTE